MYRCRNCNKEFTRKNNLRRHEIQSCKAQVNNDSVGDIINKVVRRANTDVELKEKPKKPMIPIQAVKALKPKSLSDLAADIEMRSDSEDSSEDETEEEEIDYEVMPDNPKELKEAFRNLYKQFRRDIDMFNKLVLMLDELKRMECLTQEECNAMNKHLQNKLENRN